MFKQIIKLINDKEHLTLEGLQVSIKSYLNLGLSEELKKQKKNFFFPNISTCHQARKSFVDYPKIMDPYWLSGVFD